MRPLDLAAWTVIVGLCMVEIGRSESPWPVADRLWWTGGRLLIVVGLVVHVVLQWLP